MPSRELTAELVNHERVRFCLRADGPLSEAEAVSELTAILIAADPAVDGETGRLIPGKRQTDITTCLFLSGPDAAGVIRLGGIECTHEHAATVRLLAEARGYRVHGGA